MPRIKKFRPITFKKNGTIDHGANSLGLGEQKRTTERGNFGSSMDDETKEQFTDLRNLETLRFALRMVA